MILLCAVATCTVFINTSQTVKPKKYQIDECVRVLTEAEKQGFDPELAVAVAWKESRFNAKARSSKGAIGVMQIIPKYWCPNKRRCDSVVYGIKALLRLKKLYGQRDFLCRYASGQSCKLTPANRYKQSVKRLARRVGRAYKKACPTGC